MAEDDVERESFPRLVRAQQGRLLAGICAGLGRYTGIDPLVLRVGFAILTLAGGIGIFLYIAAALLMPAEPEQAAPAERVLRRRFDGTTVLALLGGLLSLGLVFGVLDGGFSDNTLIVVTVFGLVLLVAHARNVDLVRVARSMPERLQGRSPGSYVSLEKDERPRPTLPEGMIDLATLSPPIATGPITSPAPVQVRLPQRQVLTQVTLLTALIAAAAMIPVAADHGWGARSAQFLLVPPLAVVGLGLLVSGWWGRARGLATVGTLLTFSLMTSTVAAEAPSNAKYGEVVWQPRDVAQTEQTYRIGAGEGRLDLTALPLTPGQQITINAELLIGQLKITVPAQARVRIDGRIGLGDLTVDRRISSGPNAKVNETLEPATAQPGKEPPVIVLRIRGKMGDIEVNRG